MEKVNHALEEWGYEEGSIAHIWINWAQAKGEALGIKKGEALGIKKGEALGIKKGKTQWMKRMQARKLAAENTTIARMLHKGFPAAEVAELVGVPLARVEAFAQTLDKD
ncbi:MAG: hypothetical protein OHK0039_44860 [Bacteroidia bacterium]